MNIFVLDNDPIECAKLHCDKHVVKMILETAQLLCTAIHTYTNGELVPPYKPTHKNHPCTVWVRESIENFMWTADLGVQLALEYEHRYGKQHKSAGVISWCLMNCPRFPHVPMTDHVLCMPDECKQDGLAIQSYINYYILKAQTMDMRYTNRERPDWLE
jgi:hypothetical protein